jgi:hypothetical protein
MLFFPSTGHLGTQLMTCGSCGPLLFSFFHPLPSLPSQVPTEVALLGVLKGKIPFSQGHLWSLHLVTLWQRSGTISTVGSPCSNRRLRQSGVLLCGGWVQENSARPFSRLPPGQGWCLGGVTFQCSEVEFRTFLSSCSELCFLPRQNWQSTGKFYFERWNLNHFIAAEKFWMGKSGDTILSLRVYMFWLLFLDYLIYLPTLACILLKSYFLAPVTVLFWSPPISDYSFPPFSLASP